MVDGKLRLAGPVKCADWAYHGSIAAIVFMGILHTTCLQLGVLPPNDVASLAAPRRLRSFQACWTFLTPVSECSRAWVDLRSVWAIRPASSHVAYLASNLTVLVGWWSGSVISDGRVFSELLLLSVGCGRRLFGHWIVCGTSLLSCVQVCQLRYINLVCFGCVSPEAVIELIILLLLLGFLLLVMLTSTVDNLLAIELLWFQFMLCLPIRRRWQVAFEDRLLGGIYLTLPCTTIA